MKMKIFAATSNVEIIRKFYEKTVGIKLNYLISYFYLNGQAYKATTEYRDMIDTLFLDSGAYSASTGRAKVSVSEYRTYLKLYGHLFDEYFNLDDDFDDPGHNQWNQEFIENGLPKGAKKPVPVIHDENNPFGEFAEYAELGYKFIALGSSTKLPDDFYTRAKESYPKVDIHVFGRLNWRELTEHRPYSADAKTWLDVAAIGSILYWDPDTNERHTVNMGSRVKNSQAGTLFKTFEKRDKLEQFLDQTFQYSYRDLISKGDYEKRSIVNLYYFWQMQNYLNSLD
jgi:hypothetical protein